MKAPIPDNEAQRLAVLKEYHVLGTGAEEPYDDITRLAAILSRAPFIAITLLDESRFWIKSKVGLERQEGPRDAALFCSYAILQSTPLIVRDARKDARFATSAMVVHPPHICFYAGFPLINPEGFALGALCVLDRKPRVLSARQKEGLLILARHTMAQLELRRVSDRMANLLENIKLLQGLLPICAWCKRIRDDDGYWQQVESYVRQHLGTGFTHGICPDCLEKLRPNKPKEKA